MTTTGSLLGKQTKPDLGSGFVNSGFEIDWNASQQEIQDRLQLLAEHHKLESRKRRSSSRHRMFQIMFYLLLVFILISGAWSLYALAFSTEIVRI